MPDPTDLDVTAAAPAPKKADAPKAAPAPAPVAKAAPAEKPKDEPAAEPAAPARYKILSHCSRQKSGDVVDRAVLRPNAPFASEAEADAATGAAIARLLLLGVIAPE